METSLHKRSKPKGVKEQILTAAIEILAEDGIQDLSQVQVAKRAGVRQSHLTYYFPTRDDLLSAITEQAIDGIASGLQRAISEDTKGTKRLLEQLTHSISDTAHMRMFVAMIVEADHDTAVREIVKRGTVRMEASLAEALGGDHSVSQAKRILAAVWGLGLYHFVMRSPGNDRLTHDYLSWVEHAIQGTS